MIQANYDATLDFLQRWPGPWTLTAIHPHDRTRLPTRTFHVLTEVRPWLEKHGVDHNIYFAVNPLMRDMTKKAEREDVAALAWLHVDVDPRVGEDFQAEQARILALFQSPPGGVPAPTCVVFSGGGYQGFWKLEEPFKIDGKPELYSEATLWNRQLEVLFGGDKCHNVDRIMRLPGTINWPDARKLKKGRAPALATLVSWDGGSYPLSAFAKAPERQDNGGFAGYAVTVSGNIQRITDLSKELPPEVSDRCKVIIAQGFDPDDKDRHGNSRSEWLFYACCEMVRGGCTNDQIYAVITDPDWGISKSVLDKHGRAEKYAIRQIERAREHAIDPNLMEMNEKHAVVGSVGGKCRIVSEEPDPILGRNTLVYQSAEDINLRYGNRRVQTTDANGKVSEQPLGKWWLNHSNRRQYETIVFAPGKDVPGCYNLWRGFAYDAKPGDCSLYLKHVRENICRGDESHYNYLLDWMSLAVQKPAQPGHTAIVLRGRQGTGKGFFVSTFGKLFGRHFLQVSNSDLLVGSFNAHLRDCVVLFGDEAFYAGDKKHESVLKTMVTEDIMAVQPKGIDTTIKANYVHLMMASNSQWVVPAGFDERRFFVLDVSSEHMQDLSYFSAARKQLDNGGYEALLYVLLNRDVGEFEVRHMPRTGALQEQKVLSFQADEEWWFKKLSHGEVMEGRGWPDHVLGIELIHDFTSYARQWGNSARSNETRLGHFMQTVCPAGHKLRGQLSGKHEVVLDGKPKQVNRPKVYILPTLADCRAHWDKYFGGPYDWKDPIEVARDEPETPF